MIPITRKAGESSKSMPEVYQDGLVENKVDQVSEKVFLSFFDRPLKDQIQLAVKEKDPQLVQILLGPKYCQLWKYWFIHALLSYNIVKMHQYMECDFVLKIAEAQKQAIEEGLNDVIENKINELGSRERQRFEKLFENLVTNKGAINTENETHRLESHKGQFIALLDSLVRNAYMYKEYSLFTSNDVVMLKTSMMEKVKSAIIDYKQKLAEVYSNHMEQFLLHPDPSVGSLILNLKKREEDDISSCYIKHLFTQIQETNRKMINTQNGRLDTFCNSIALRVKADTQDDSWKGWLQHKMSGLWGGTQTVIKDPATTKLMAHGVNILSRDKVTQQNAESIIAAISLLLKQIELTPSDPISEIKKIYTGLTNLEENTQAINEELEKISNEIKTQILDKITDNTELCNQTFSREIYAELMHQYLEIAVHNQKHPLYYDLNQNKGKQIVEDKIRTQMEKLQLASLSSIFTDVVQKNPNADRETLQVLLFNMVIPCEYNRIIQHTTLKDDLSRSGHVIMINLHKRVFRFGNRSSPLAKLVSEFPLISGNLKEHRNTTLERGLVAYNEKYKKENQIFEEIRNIRKQVEDERKLNDHRNNRSNLARLWGLLAPFFIIKDYFYPGLTESQSSTIFAQDEELRNRLLYAVHLNDPGIIFDYMKKKINLKQEARIVQKYAHEIHQLPGKRGEWNRSPEEYEFKSFLVHINTIKEKQIEEETVVTQQEVETAKQEKNAAKQEVETAKQEVETVKQEVETAKQEKNAAEQKAYATNQFMCQLIGLEGPLQKIVHQESDTIIKQVCQLPKTKIEPALEKIFQKIQTNKEEILRKTQLSRQVIEEWIQNDLQLII